MQVTDELRAAAIERALDLVRQGQSHAAAQQPDAARSCVAAALALVSDDVGIRHIAGVVCSEIGDFDTAIEHLHAALALVPDFHHSAMQIGTIHDARGQLDEAIAWYERVSALAPAETVARRRAAAAHGQLGAHDRAIEILDALIAAGDADPDLADERAAHAAACARQERVRSFVTWLPLRETRPTPAWPSAIRPSPPPGWEKVHLICAEARPGSGATFDETMDGLAIGLHELGCTVDIDYGLPRRADGVTLVVGAHLLALRAGELALPPRTVLVNLEQMASWSGRNPVYRRLLARYPVWDYSPRNIVALREAGVGRIGLLRIGHVAELHRIPAGPEPDIDILFYGAINPRRGAILDALEARGLRVQRLFGAFREARDAWIARSRLLLNIHYFDDHIFEVVRCSYLLANGKAVVSEIAPDTEIEDNLRPAVYGATYDGLVDACAGLLADPAALARQAARGARIFRARSQAAFLAEAIAATELP